MTDYRVLHITVAAGEDRGGISARIEKECDNAAREGWYLDTVIPDIANGATAGMWLVFGTADDAVASDPAVATAAEIISHAAEDERPAASA